MVQILNKGNDVEYTRNKFTVVPALDLSEQYGKDKFFEHAYNVIIVHPEKDERLKDFVFVE